MNSSPAMGNATASGSGSGSGSNTTSSTFETKIIDPTNSGSSSGNLNVDGKERKGGSNEDGDVEMGDAGSVEEGKELEGDKVALPWAFIDCEIDSLIELVGESKRQCETVRLKFIDADGDRILSLCLLDVSTHSRTTLSRLASPYAQQIAGTQ